MMYKQLILVVVVSLGLSVISIKATNDIPHESQTPVELGNVDNQEVPSETVVVNESTSPIESELPLTTQLPKTSVIATEETIESLEPSLEFDSTARPKETIQSTLDITIDPSINPSVQPFIELTTVNDFSNISDNLSESIVWYYFDGNAINEPKSKEALTRAIQNSLIVTGERIAKYNSPKFGYITKFNMSDGYTYYCIDPWTLFVAGSGYVGTQIDYNKIPFETLLYIAKCISYGYGYGNHTSDDYFIATQLLIWDALGYSVSGLTTLNNQSIDVSGLKSEILATMESVKIQPSFDGAKITCGFNQECKIKDENEVLSTYYVIDENATSKNFSEGYPYINDNHELVVKTDKIYEIEKIVSVKSKEAGYHDAVKGMLLMSKAGSQDLLAGKLPDPIFDARIWVLFNRRTITIEKYDEYLAKGKPGTKFQLAYDPYFKHLIVPTCDMGLVSESSSISGTYSGSCIYFNENTQSFEERQADKFWTIGSDGTLVIDGILPYDAYSTLLNSNKNTIWIREYSTPFGYELNNAGYEVKLQGENTVIPFVNKLTSLNLQVTKHDEQQQYRLLDGAKFEVFEIIDDNFTRLDDTVFGVINSSSAPFPEIGNKKDFQLTYRQLKQLLPQLEVGKTFIHDQTLYKILSISNDVIKVGYSKELVDPSLISLDMLPSNISIMDEVEVNSLPYSVIAVNPYYIVLNNAQTLTPVVNNKELIYKDLTYCKIDKPCQISDDVSVNITYSDALLHTYNLVQQISVSINPDNRLYDLISNLEETQLPFKYVTGNVEWIITNIEKTNEIEDIDITYQVVIKDLNVENTWIAFDYIPSMISQEYKYTLLDTIEPSYTFQSEFGDTQYHNQVVEVSIDSSNDFLSFMDVQDEYPWQTHLIQVGQTITKSYPIVIKDAITLDLLRTLISEDTVEVMVFDQMYGVENIIFESIDDTQVLTSVDLIDTNGKRYTINDNTWIDSVIEMIDVSWECKDVNYPSFITTFNDANEQLFNDFPFQKDAQLHFMYIDGEPLTYNNYDSNNDGVIDINNDRFEELIYTHPIDYNDLSLLYTLDQGSDFSVIKDRAIDTLDTVSINNISMYIVDYDQYGYKATLIYTFDNGPSYSLIKSLINQSSFNYEGINYTVIENLENEANCLSLQTDDGTVIRYFTQVVSKYDKRDELNDQFDANIIEVAIDKENPFDYNIVKAQLELQGIDIKECQINDEVKLYIEGKTKSFTVIFNQILDGIHQMILDDEVNQYVIRQSVLENRTLFFIEKGQTVSLSSFFNTDDSIIYALDNFYDDASYHGYIKNNNLTALRHGDFTVYALMRSKDNPLLYEQLVNINEGDQLSVNDSIYTVLNKNDEYIEYKNQNDQVYRSEKAYDLSLHQIKQIHEDVPLMMQGYFTWQDVQYHVDDIVFDQEGVIESITLTDTYTNEQFTITKDTNKYLNISYQAICSYDFVVTSNKLSNAIETVTVQSLGQFETGRSYLKIVNPYMPNKVMANYQVNLYADPSGLALIDTGYTDEYGVYDVTHLEEGVYFYNAPYTVFNQEIIIDHQQGTFTVGQLKYSREYMACEIELPTGYDYSENQEVCVRLKADESSGYNENQLSINIDVVNKLRRMDLHAYKVDSHDASILLNGAVFKITDLYDDGVNYCDVFDTQLDQCVQFKKDLGHFISGGILIEDYSYEFKNPIEYEKLLELISNQGLQENDTFEIDDSEYTIVDIQDDSDYPDILYKDELNQYHGSLDEKRWLTNYIKIANEGVSYEIADNANFENSMIATTDTKGWIRFVPSLSDTALFNKEWYYRKVDITYDDSKQPYISGVYPTNKQYVVYGKIILEDVLYGHNYQLCEVESPFGYLRDVVCTTITPENEYTQLNVNYYRANTRNRYWKTWIKTKIVRKLRLRKLGENKEDSFIQWYQDDYMYERKNNYD